MPQKLIFCLIFLFSVLSTHAQDGPEADIVHWGSVSELQDVNPAYAGDQDAMVFDSKVGLHFTDLPVNPLHFKLSFDTHIEKWNSGLGLNIAYDGSGFRNYRQVNINWNVKIPISETETHHLRVGFAGGIIQNSVFMEKKDLVYPRPAGKDPFEIFATESYNIPEIRLGFWYRNKNFFAGLSFHHLFPININKLSGINNGDKQFLLPEIFVNAGYALELSDNFHLLGQLNLRYHQIGFYWQPLIRAIIANRAMIGAGISNNRLHFEAGIRIVSQLRISYGYGMWYKGLNEFHSGLHTIGLKVALF